ncbi:MAG: L-rhamnose mutarotase [Acidobacteria bacterium]|nr:MAG: L-rhamnose mutarotase [Acidobacteriota bacterium]
MERVCFLLKVKSERLEEYKERHKAVWPEMLEALRETGWRNYSLFLREDGLLVGYLETPDYPSALSGMAGREINQRWQREMAPFFEGLEGRRPDQGLLRLEEVFHLD